MLKIGIKRVSLAGFDGYSSDRLTNYYSSEMEYKFAKQKGGEISAYVNKILSVFKQQMEINFITTTAYCFDL